MKNKLVLFLIIALILGFGIFMFLGSGKAILSGDGLDPNKEVQVVKLSVENGQYIMSPSEIKKGIPVRIEADMSKMPGCSKSIVISSFNVKKTFNSESNTVEFIPDKAGTFNIACSMNMYQGKFTVLENDGSKSAYVEQAPAGGGASGGGCGCGG